MAYNPRQLRGPDGRWIKMPGSGGLGHDLIKAATKTTRKTIGPIRVETAGQQAYRNRRGRGSGFKGFKQNARPYVRINKRSQTAGINAGTIIPGSRKRIVVGGYTRLETTRSKTAVDRFVDKGFQKAFPEKSRRGKKLKSFRKNFATEFSVQPKGRLAVGRTQARLGTSRHAGPTVIVKYGGPHKTPVDLSNKGVSKYNKRMKAIAGERKKMNKQVKRRAQRRNAAARKRRSRKKRR